MGRLKQGLIGKIRVWAGAVDDVSDFRARRVGIALDDRLDLVAGTRDQFYLLYIVQWLRPNGVSLRS